MFLTGIATVLIILAAVWAADTHFAEYREAEVAIAVLDGAAERPFLGEGDAHAGKQVFATHCSSCHGAAGEGQIGLAPNVANGDFLALASDLFIKQTVNRGRPGTAMIARPDLTDADLTHIVTYLRSLPESEPIEVEMDPERVVKGDPENGAHLFAVYCAACHGTNGEGYSAGGPAPGIGLPGFLEAASDDYILNTLRYGRTGTPMRAFLGSKGLANLTEDEAEDIISFLRSNVDAAMDVASRPSPHLSGPPDPAKGEALFAVNCAACHQEGGVGKPGLAPSIRNRDFLALASDNFIRSTVLVGRAGTAMVPRADLHGAPLEHIIAYLRDVPVVTPVEFDREPGRECVGDPRNGKALFASYCASCHGPNGEGYSAGGAGPGIGLPSFLSVATDEYIFQTIKRGRIGTPMRGFVGASGLANLSEQEVNDIVVYLRTVEIASEAGGTQLGSLQSRK